MINYYNFIPFSELCPLASNFFRFPGWSNYYIFNFFLESNTSLHFRAYFAEKSIRYPWLLISSTRKKPLEHFLVEYSFFNYLLNPSFTVGASSQCYWDELMLLKCKINTKTNKNGFLLSTKCLERTLKYSYLDSII